MLVVELHGLVQVVCFFFRHGLAEFLHPDVVLFFSVLPLLLLLLNLQILLLLLPLQIRLVLLIHGIHLSLQLRSLLLIQPFLIFEVFLHFPYNFILFL